MVVADGLMASMVRPGQGGVYFLPVDEIIRRKGWRTYKDMLYDDQVKACLAFKKILIHGRTWELSPHDATPKAKEVADFATWCLNKIDFNHVVEEGLSALEFGYSLAEKVFTRDKYEGKQVVCLKKLAFRDPETLNLQMDANGNWTGARQQALGKTVNLTPDELFLYTYRKQFGNIYGESDLRAVYRHWWAKKFLINFWNVFLERMGAPMMLMKYPMGSGDDLKKILVDILKNLGSKTEVLVPEGVNVQLVEATRSGNATYEQALGYHNNSIARAILMSALFGTGGEDEKNAGNNSQGFLQLRILFKMADAIAQDFAKAIMEQIVKQIIQLNYAEDIDTIMPNFVWQDYGQFEGIKIADEIRQLHAAGIIDMDQTDVNYARSVLGLPIRGEKDKQDVVIRPAALPPPGNSTAIPPAAPQGNERAGKGGSAEGDSTDPVTKPGA